LGGFDRSGFIKIAAVINVQSVECILEREDIPLVQLRESPVASTPRFVSIYSKVVTSHRARYIERGKSYF
jgi:hypothetical protein